MNSYRSPPYIEKEFTEATKPIAGDFDATLVSLTTNSTLNVTSTPELLGVGTNGTVWKVSIGRGLVALKQGKLNGNGVDYSLVLEANLLGLPSSISRMQHPNVVQLLDVAISDKSMALVLPLAEKSLHKYISEKWAKDRKVDRGIDIDTAKHLILQIARGIAYIQSMDVLHGDYKSANILLYEEEGCNLHAVITDFGIGVIRDCYEVNQVPPYFTVWYRAPELILRDRYTANADSWALGCLAVEIMTGKVPFQSNTEPDMLHLMFRRLGKPDEESWPGVTKLPEWNKQLLDKIEESRLEYKSSEDVPVSHFSSLQLESRYAYYDLGNNRIPLSAEDNTFLNELLVYTPTKRKSAAFVTYEDAYLEETRRKISGIPCLAAPTTDTVADCDNTLTKRIDIIQSSKAILKRGSRRTDVITLLIRYAGALGMPDRCVAIAVHLMDAYSSRSNTAYTHPVFAAVLSLASMVTSSAILTVPKVSDASNAIAAAKIQREIFVVLNGVIHVTTVYDLLRQYSEVYGRLVKDACKELVLLSYYTNIIVGRNPEIVALCLLKLVCTGMEEPFKHSTQLKKHSEEAIRIIEAFVTQIVTVINSMTNNQWDITTRVCETGQLRIKTLLRSIKLIGGSINPGLIREEGDYKATIANLKKYYA